MAYVGRNPQQQILKNKEDIEELQQAMTDATLSEMEVVPASSTTVTASDEGVYFHALDCKLNGNTASPKDIPFGLQLPLKGGDGVVVDATEDGKAAEIRIDAHTFYQYAIAGTPTGAKSGTLPANIVQALQAADVAVLTLDNENYYKSDNQHSPGTLVFSHAGYESLQLFVKTITITIAGNSWVKTTIRPVMVAVQFSICLLNNYYYTPPLYFPQTDSESGLEITNKEMLQQMGEGVIVGGGIFTYGDAVYAIRDIQFIFNESDDDDGGIVHCYKLSDGSEAHLQFTRTQLYIDEQISAEIAYMIE